MDNNPKDAHKTTPADLFARRDISGDPWQRNEKAIYKRVLRNMGYPNDPAPTSPWVDLLSALFDLVVTSCWIAFIAYLVYHYIIHAS